MKVTVKRQKPGENPYYETFLFEGSGHISVAHVIDEINYRDDMYDISGKKCSRIVWDCSCQQKMCGACAMVINGTPALACAAFIDNLKLKNDTLLLEPLSKFRVIEDLKVDRDIIFENLKHLRLWQQGEMKSLDGKMLYNAAKCLKCGLCLEVCPNYVNGTLFAGPAMTPDAYLTKKQAGRALDKETKCEITKHHTSHCSKDGACAEICPMKMNTLSMTAELLKL